MSNILHDKNSKLVFTQEGLHTLPFLNICFCIKNQEILDSLFLFDVQKSKLFKNCTFFYVQYEDIAKNSFNPSMYNMVFYYTEWNALQDEEKCRLSSIAKNHKSIGITGINDIRIYHFLRDLLFEDCITAPIAEQDLYHSILRILEENRDVFHGKSFAFFGSKSGVGSTMLAINFAHYVSDILNFPCLYVDCDCFSSTSFLYFQKPSEKSFIDILNSSGESNFTDANSICSFSKERSFNYIASMDGRVSFLIDEKDIQISCERFIRNLCLLFPYVILDFSSGYAPFLKSFLNICDSTICTFEPTLSNLFLMRSICEQVEESNAESIFYFLNKKNNPYVPYVQKKEIQNIIQDGDITEIMFNPLFNRCYLELSNIYKIFHKKDSNYCSINSVYKKILSFENFSFSKKEKKFTLIGLKMKKGITSQ